MAQRKYVDAAFKKKIKQVGSTMNNERVT